jgi:radical SAM protein with 4Fe4S-binding SPASM domain
MNISLGIGLTNDCNLECAHCYRPSPPLAYLPRKTVSDVCDALPVGGVNLGTGENALHPEFRGILDDLLERGLRVSLTSNGYSIGQLPDSVLRDLHDIEVSIDFPSRARFDEFRGDGAWDTATRALERCRSLGIETTVLAVLMRENHRDLPALAKLAAAYGAPLRVNVYQPVKRFDFAPSYDEFWVAVRDLLESTTLLACSERVVRAAIGAATGELKCGSTSVRVTPNGDVLPCVYSPDPVARAADLTDLGTEVFETPGFRKYSRQPKECVDCEHAAVCGGGCSSRRMLAFGTLDERDPYCPKRGDIQLGDMVQAGSPGGRLHTGNVCTLLVSA